MKYLIIKAIIGVIAGFGLGWAFLWLIDPPLHVIYWWMFGISVLIANFFPILFYTLKKYSNEQLKEQAKNDREINVELMGFFIGVFAFGVEGVVISLLYGKVFVGLIPVIAGSVGLVSGVVFKSRAAMLLLGGISLAISGYIVGFIFGETLGFLALIHFLVAILTVILNSVVDLVINPSP